MTTGQLKPAITLDLERMDKVVVALVESGRGGGFTKTPAQAFFIAQFYTGLESCLEKMGKLYNLPAIQKIASFHKELLAAALRANFILPEHAPFLTDLLEFRHFTRHAYGSEPLPEKVEQKVKLVLETWPGIRAQLELKLNEK